MSEGRTADRVERPRKVRTAILTEIISPYRIEPFNCLAQYPDIELLVLFLSETERRRRWRVPMEKIRFASRVLPGRQVGRVYQDGPVFFNPTVIWSLRAFRPDVVICNGWHHPTYWLALAYARLAGARRLIWSESTAMDQRSPNPFKEGVKRLAVRESDGLIVPGKAQAQYLLSLGAASARIWYAPNAVDTAFFSGATERFRRSRTALKREMGLNDLVVLYVGRLTAAKGVGDLLAAFSQVARPPARATLMLVGDGPDEERYKQECQKSGMEHVRFMGFQDQERLPAYYAVADLFVFPTHSDPWGLVVNEAMAAGLPIICSRAAGAAGELIDEGRNGFLHDPGDIAGLAGSMRILLHDEVLRRQMGEESLRRIGAFTPQQMAEGFARAVRAVDGGIARAS